MRRLALLLAGAAAVVVLVASANAAGTTQIEGLQSPDPTCGGTPLEGIYGMQGSLVGCWYTTSITYYKEHQGGTAQIRGTETFVGCVNPIGDCNNSATTYGTFDTTFTFTAKFDGRPPDVTLYQEVHGRCQHPIVGGTGVFAGATGVLTFKDDVTNGTAPYKGHITLQ